jgi:alpha-ketoglutarate-dependent taurine dioxygenase
MSVTITPLTRHLGVEISGLSGRVLVDRHAAGECLAALQQYGVVVYRDVHIDDDDLVAFSRMLGEVVVVPTGEHERPEIQTITFDPSTANAQLAAYRQANFFWHIDGAHDAVPQKGTLLAAHEVDDAGGDTEFASTFAAYDDLPEAEKGEIADLRVVHRFSAALLHAFPDASEKERARWDRVAPRVHPLVWTHTSGRRSMLLGSTADEIVGWPRDKGRALLDRLLEWSTQPQFVLRHHWRRGDLVTWDNTGMLHRALPFAPTSRRLLHRTTLVGEEAVS